MPGAGLAPGIKDEFLSDLCVHPRWGDAKNVLSIPREDTKIVCATLKII